MKRRIFLEDYLEKSFQMEGYVIIPLLTPDEVAQLRDQVIPLQSGVKTRFYASLWSKDRAYRQTVDRLIKEALLERAGEKLFQYIPLFGDLLVKKPSIMHGFNAHQDWAFVDENHFTSVYVWCPLQPVSKYNGTLQVIPRTQKFLPQIRGANIKKSYDSYSARIRRNHGICLRLKAGEAVFFNQAMMHASPPNRSMKTRISAGLLFLPQEAQIWHYMQDPETGLTYRIKADYEFFMTYSENIDFSKNLHMLNIKLPPGVTLEPIFISDEPMTYSAFKKQYQVELAKTSP